MITRLAALIARASALTLRTVEDDRGTPKPVRFDHHPYTASLTEHERLMAWCLLVIIAGLVIPLAFYIAIRALALFTHRTELIILGFVVAIAMVIVPLVLMAQAWAGAWFFWPARRKQALRANRLAAAHCPACSYSIAAAKPEDDGFTTCPECGAQWQAETNTTKKQPDPDKPALGMTIPGTVP